METKGVIKQVLGIDGQNINILLSLTDTNITDSIEALAGEDLSVTLKKYHEKRSLSANAYCWVLITKIANHPDINSSKDEIYEEMLQKYGVLYQDENGYITITVKSIVDMSKIGGHWKYYDGNEKWASYMKIKGTSEYDRAEMARFIDCIITEAKELGIETLPPEDLERMLDEWQRCYGASLPTT